jgi:hypothetical protein
MKVNLSHKQEDPAYHESQISEGRVELELALGGGLHLLAEALETLLELVAQLALCLLSGQVVPVFITRKFMLETVLRIRIAMFLGLLDPDPDPLVRGTDPAPDPEPSIIKQK